MALMKFWTALPEVTVRQIRSAFGEILQCLNREIRIHCTRAIASQQRKVHDLARLAGFDDQRYPSASFFPNQQIVNRCEGEQDGIGA